MEKSFTSPIVGHTLKRSSHEENSSIKICPSPNIVMVDAGLTAVKVNVYTAGRLIMHLHCFHCATCAAGIW